MNSQIVGVGDFKYDSLSKTSNEPKELSVVMATKFRQKAKLSQISIPCKTSRNFSHV